MTPSDQRTIVYSAELTVTQCWCGIHCAVPANLYREAREHGQNLHCPLGHVFVFMETDLQRDRKAREAAEGRASRAEARRQAERDLREHVERQLAAQKGATAKARKRAAAALCPCCNRSFVQLRRHLDTKHPDYDPERAD